MPIATVLPSVDKEIYKLLLSPAVSPLISEPICVHVLACFYTSAHDLNLSISSLRYAPIATVLPSADMKHFTTFDRLPLHPSISEPI